MLSYQEEILNHFDLHYLSIKQRSFLIKFNSIPFKLRPAVKFHIVSNTVLIITFEITLINDERSLTEDHTSTPWAAVTDSKQALELGSLGAITAILVSSG